MKYDLGLVSPHARELGIMPTSVHSEYRRGHLHEPHIHVERFRQPGFPGRLEERVITAAIDLCTRLQLDLKSINPSNIGYVAAQTLAVTTANAAKRWLYWHLSSGSKLAVAVQEDVGRADTADISYRVQE